MLKFKDMSSYVISVDEKIVSGKKLLSYLKSLNKTSDYLSIKPYKEESINGLDEAIEDLKMGRVETYENFDEFKKSVYQELGYV